MADLRQRWEICFHCGPWIHPEDAIKAIHTHLYHTRQRRKKVSEAVIVEDLFIASLANHRPWNKDQIAQIEKRSSSEKFNERFARACAQGRTPIFDEYDILILSNWRELHIKPEIEKKVGKLPGLCEWSPKAIEGLFELAKINVKSKKNFEAWFMTRRKRLGLVGKHRHRIKDFVVIDDSIQIVK